MWITVIIQSSCFLAGIQWVAGGGWWSAATQLYSYVVHSFCKHLYVYKKAVTRNMFASSSMLELMNKEAHWSTFPCRGSGRSMWNMLVAVTISQCTQLFAQLRQTSTTPVESGADGQTFCLQQQNTFVYLRNWFALFLQCMISAKNQAVLKAGTV